MFKEMKKRRLLTPLGGRNPGASEAAEALAKLGDLSIIPILLNKLGTKDVHTELPLSIELLGKLGDRTTPRAILDNLQPRAHIYFPLVEAFDRLRASHDEWIEMLSAIVQDTSYKRGDYDDYRIKAIERFAQFGLRAMPVLKGLAGDRIRPETGDRSSQVRRSARNAIARIPVAGSQVPARGAYSDEEIQFILDSLTAWSVARHGSG
jgi:hypothetical protein